MDYLSEIAFMSRFMQLPAATRSKIGHQFEATDWAGGSFQSKGMFRRCLFKGVDCNDARSVDASF